MERTLQLLTEILGKLIGLERQLLELVRNEKTILVSSKIDEIQEITYSKQVLLSSINEIERQRINCVGELALYLKKKPAELGLENIAVLIQTSHPEFAQKLRSARNTIQILIKHVMEQNRENQRLVGESLLHIRNMKANAVGQSLQKNDVYSKKGTKVSKASDSRLLNKEI